MSIQRSASPDIARLVAELSSADSLRRETAVARLAVIGTRAVSSLIAVADDAASTSAARVAALQTLEAIGDARAGAVALSLLDQSDLVLARAAIGVLGPIARQRDARGSRALERLAAIALGQEAAIERRLSALAALEGLPDALLSPIYRALEQDPTSDIAARVTRRRSGTAIPLTALIERGLPDDPAVLSAIVREDADNTRPQELRVLIEEIRKRERRAPADRRAAWMAVRGLAHQSLAARGSRLAVYDLRETIEQATGTLPVGFLAAAAAAADASCLEPLAGAWARASPDDRWWRDHLAEAFRAIVKREHLTRRHKTVRKILEKWPAAGRLI